MDCAKRIKFVRILTGLNIREFANKYDIDYSYLLKVESGRVTPSYSQMKKIVDCLREESVLCSLEWLFEGIGQFPQLGLNNYWRIYDDIKEDSKIEYKDVISF